MAHSGITARQQRAIEALMVQPTIDAAAKSAGVSRTTLWRWLQDETFCNALKRFQSDVLSQTVRTLTSLSASSVGVLAVSMGSDNAPAVRLRAADITLSKLMHLKELHEIEARIAALEVKAKA